MDIQKEVVDYIKEGLMLGYSLPYLKRQLALEGYSHAEIKEYAAAIDPERIERQRKALGFLWFFGAVVLFAVLVIFTSLYAESAVLPVLIGFSPTLVSILISVAVLELLPAHRSVIWTIPFFTAAVFYAIGIYGNLAILAELEVGSLAVFNLIASFVFPSIATIMGVTSPTVQHTLVESSTEEQTEEDVEDQPPELQPAAHSQVIKNNAQKLNLAINKVYTQRNGGTASIRNKIRILSEWLRNISSHDQGLVKKSLHNVQERLSLLYMQEKQLFPDAKFKNLDRDPSGKTRIIDILIDNTSEETQKAMEEIMHASDELFKHLQKSYASPSRISQTKSS